MNFKVELSSKAFKALSKLDIIDRKGVLKKIGTLEDTPFPSGYKKLRSEEDVYRLQAGDLRIIYKLLKSEESILVFKIEKRSKAYGK